jgi:predicted secreted hydrolase
MKRRGVLTNTLAGMLTAACGRSGVDSRLLSESALDVMPAPAPKPRDFPPVQFPQDEAPHDVLAEWWYYTGHLYEGSQPAGTGGKGLTEGYGLELVFFRGVRGDRPPGYAAHFAIADLAMQRFQYDQRQDIALSEKATPTIQASSAAPTSSAGSRPPGIVALVPPGGGFDMALGGWQIQGLDGQDRLRAKMDGYAIDLALSATRPPALHLGAPPLFPGLISFGPAGYSYYYSRTRMEVRGTISVEGRTPMPVHGDAWMDHQWGDFLVLGGGGWDWFAGSLSDGRDITLSLIRDETGTTVLAYGTLVDAEGEAHHLPPGSFAVTPTGSWTSRRTGITYPSGWRLEIPSERVDLLWRPLLEDQELDTRASTGVIYWEGAVSLHDTATRADLGRGYVELTGYTAKR